MGKILLSLLLLGAVALLVYGGLSHQQLKSGPYYVTSEACADCHELEHASWQRTLHPKMFRPVTRPDDILGDFSTPDPAVTFKKEAIEYVVGNRWEQVYVRIIEGEYYPLPAKWLVQKKQWIPYKVNDWQDTPMTKKCNGCHVTGFEPDTGEFAEFGIGCEACHGPGSRHTANRNMVQQWSCTLCHDHLDNGGEGENDIIRTVAPTVCGQCHSRGKNAQTGNIAAGRFNFPVNNLPGDNIDSNFTQKLLANDPENKYWWGFGISKNRHQEYADWGKSGHAKALAHLQEGNATRSPSCSKGAPGDACLTCHSADYHFAKEDEKPTLDTARYGVTCVSCHNPHGLDRLAHDDIPGKCGNCHMDNFANHDGDNATSHTSHPAGVVGCVDCHMPRTVKTGGFFSLRSHAFRIVPPHASIREKMPNSCQNGSCHADRSVQWTLNAFDKHFPGLAEKLLESQ
jgi:hypothetical protein